MSYTDEYAERLRVWAEEGARSDLPDTVTDDEIGAAVDIRLEPWR